MPLMIHVWCMVTENCAWRKILKSCAWRLILKYCVWRVILKHCAWRLPDTSKTPSDASQTQHCIWLASGWRLAGVRHNVLKSHVRCNIIKSGVCLRRNISKSSARHNISKSGVRRKISKSCVRRYFLWPGVRRPVRVRLCTGNWFLTVHSEKKGTETVPLGALFDCP